MTLEPTLDEIQKLLLLIKFLGMQALSLAIGPLVGAEGSIPKAIQKQSQVERLRRELDEQISRYLSTPLPDPSEVRLLLLVSRLGNGIDAMSREAVRIGELAQGPVPSPAAARQVRGLFETGCEVLNHAVAALFDPGTPAPAKSPSPSLEKAREEGGKLAAMLERARQAEEASALFAAVSRVALHAQAAADEIAAFLAAQAPEGNPGPGAGWVSGPDLGNRIRVSRS